MNRTGKVGIFGGTFNPIHIGHLRAAEEAAEALALDCVIFVPSAEPPHKRARDHGPLAPAAQRLAWVQASIRGNPRLCVDPLEIERGGTSYSVETLRAIGARTAPERPVFLIGLDAFLEVDGWREPEALFTLADFAVIPRPPFVPASLAELLPKCVRDDVALEPGGLSARHRGAGTCIRLLQIPGLEVSSSDIRARLREGRSVRYLLRDEVLEAVQRAGVYRQVR